MKRLSGILIFMAGLGIGGWIGSQRGSVSKEISKTSSESKSKPRESRPARTPHEAKWQTFGKTAARMSIGERQEFLKKLGSADRISALEAIARQSGPNGLSSELQLMMSEILRQWAAEDFEGAWAWSTHCEPLGMRSFVKHKLLGELNVKDPGRAFDLHLAEVAEDPTFMSDVSRDFVRKDAGKNAGEFVDVLSKFSFGGMSGSGWNTPFAKDFDFKTAADGVVEMMKEREGSRPREFPANFISEWSKRDPEAAHEWIMGGGSLPFGRWSDIYESVDASRGSQAVAEWTAARIETAGESREKLLDGLGSLPQGKIRSSLQSIAELMPDTESKDRFYSEILVAGNGYKDSAALTDTAISGLSTPAARLDAFRVMKDKFQLVTMPEVDDEKFQQWGVSREQVSEIFEKHKP